MPEQDADKVRIDKWLWAARFFKTRSQATAAVDGGEVLVDGARVKPAKALKAGDELIIRTTSYEYAVRVVQLSERRGPAPEAARLYQETGDRKRNREGERRTRATRDPIGMVRGRPTKRARRQLERFRGDT